MLRDEIHIRDPFVFVEDSRYYLLGTTGDDPWGRASDLALYQSDDLNNFERICVMVNDGSLDEYTNIWAPEMHKYKGKYYLIVSVFGNDLGRGSIIFKSDKLDGNFKMLTGKYITSAGCGDALTQHCLFRTIPHTCAFQTNGQRLSAETVTEAYIWHSFQMILPSLSASLKK